MLFEAFLIAATLGLGVFFVGIPVWKIAQRLFPKKTDHLEEARIRLEIAQKEREAIRLEKEAEQVYDELYKEALEEDTSKHEKGSR